MITVISYKINTLDQNSYEKFLDSINYCQLSCSCGIPGCLIRHGRYSRSVKTPEGITALSIQRVKCKQCGKTHAIFSSMIVPFSQILLKDQAAIITAYTEKVSFKPIMQDNVFIDESNIRYVIRQFKSQWKERAASFGFQVTENLLLLVRQCLSTFRRQFMQIKCIPNIMSG